MVSKGVLVGSFATQQGRSTGTLVNNEVTSKESKISHPRVSSEMKVAKLWELI